MHPKVANTETLTRDPVSGLKWESVSMLLPKPEVPGRGQSNLKMAEHVNWLSDARSWTEINQQLHPSLCFFWLHSRIEKEQRDTTRFEQGFAVPNADQAHFALQLSITLVLFCGKTVPNRRQVPKSIRVFLEEVVRGSKH